MAFKSEDHSDMKLFKNRLWHLMEEKGIETSKSLATELYDAGLVKPKKRNNSYEFEDLDKPRNNAIGAIDERIKFCLKANTADSVKGDLIKAFSIFFGCSTDYLYGLIPHQTHEITNIQREIGLSEDAIKRLQRYVKEDSSALLDPLNFFLESESDNDFGTALYYCYAYKQNYLSLIKNEYKRRAEEEAPAINAQDEDDPLRQAAARAAASAPNSSAYQVISKLTAKDEADQITNISKYDIHLCFDETSDRYIKMIREQLDNLTPEEIEHMIEEDEKIASELYND